MLTISLGQNLSVWQLKHSTPIDDIVALRGYMCSHTLIYYTHCFLHGALSTVLSPKKLRLFLSSSKTHHHTHTHSTRSVWRCPLLVCEEGGRCVLSPAVMPLNLPTVSIFAYQNNKNNLGRSEISIIGGKAV